MGIDLTSALRMAGTGLLAGGALAVGAAAGAVLERTLMRKSVLADEDDWGDEFGVLRGTPMTVLADDGSELHIEIDEGPDDLTVIFAHGYALSLDSWHYQREALRGTARLVFYDQRSHGRSMRADFDTHHVEQLGADLATVIEACAPTGPVVLVGHSMGGMTIMALAAAHPEWFGDRVRGVALISTTAGGLNQVTLGLPAPLGRLVQSAAPAVASTLAGRKEVVRLSDWGGSDLGLLLTRVYAFGSKAPAGAGRFVAHMVSTTALDVLAEFLPALHDHDKRDVLPVLQNVQLLVVVGDADRLTPVAASEEIVRSVPGADFVVLHDSGHMAILEVPEQIDELLISLVVKVRRDLPPAAAAS